MRGNLISTVTFIFIISSCTNGKKERSDYESSKPISSTDTANLSRPYVDTLILVSSGQIMPYKTVNINNSKFQLVKDVDDDTSFLNTWDESFITPEGYHAGMRLGQIGKKYQNKLQKEPGWGYYVKLPSNWNLKFEIGESTTDHFPRDTNKVIAIFKRR